MNKDDSKRTEEGKRRHDLGKKIYYEKKRLEKIAHEENNGLELGYPNVRISDYLKEKILSGKTQVLFNNETGEFLLFRKKADNGYWFNTHNRKGEIIYLHREKVRLNLGFTKEQMEGLDVHHIDGNKDNNNIENLRLLTKKEHMSIHHPRKSSSHRHVCKKCGRTYWSTVSRSKDLCDRCDSSLAIGGSSMITIKKICEYCGAEYETKGVNRNRSKFCSNKCKSAYRRASKVDDIERVCERCGSIYLINKYSSGKICRKCSGK